MKNKKKFIKNLLRKKKKIYEKKIENKSLSKIY